MLSIASIVNLKELKRKILSRSFRSRSRLGSGFFCRSGGLCCGRFCGGLLGCRCGLSRGARAVRVLPSCVLITAGRLIKNLANVRRDVRVCCENRVGIVEALGRLVCTARRAATRRRSAITRARRDRQEARLLAVEERPNELPEDGVGAIRLQANRNDVLRGLAAGVSYLKGQGDGEGNEND